MNIKNRFYTYPVLSEDTDDYIDSSFEVDFTYQNKGIATLEISADVKLDNKELEELVNNKKANIYLHVECSLTSYRKLYPLYNNMVNTIPIDIKKINGKIELLALVIALEDIDDYSSESFNEDYENRTFFINKGAILAFKNIGFITISKSMQEFKKLESIFSVTKLNSEEETPFSVNLEDNKIKIGLPPQQHQFYIDKKDDLNYQYLFNSLLVLPALVYTFEQLAAEGLDMYQDKEWCVALENNFERLGKNFVEELEKIDSGEISSIELSQTLMEYPIKSAFSHLENIIEGDDEDED
ncbi:MAG: hypothetical protein IJS83_00155 [Acholeplasmatales bacterium]|nr:hypothetical protein [Acholeplasmatales bacterium]